MSVFGAVFNAFVAVLCGCSCAYGGNCHCCGVIIAAVAALVALVDWGILRSSLSLPPGASSPCPPFAWLCLVRCRARSDVEGVLHTPCQNATGLQALRQHW